MKRIPIVWIELGRKLPPHLRANIQLHKAMHPHLEQILITDQKVSRKLRKICKIIQSEDLLPYLAEDELESNINRSTQQREFWVNTTRRFLVLEGFIKQSGVSQLVHLESDNVLLISSIFDSVFDDSGWGMAYPMQADGIGCASILLVDGIETLHEFNGLVIKQWNEKNQDDMRLLGLFSNNPRVQVLNSFPETDFVFDPQTFGRFLLGTDARNMRFPFARRGIQDSRSGAIDIVRSITFKYSEEIRRVLVRSQFKESQLANIHIHSKRVPKSAFRLFRMIARDIENMDTKNWYRGVLDWRVFLERSLSWLSRNILRSGKEIRLR